MDIHIARDFAASLLAACEGDEVTTIKPQCLTEPQFLTTLSDFLGNILTDWTKLPPQLRAAFQNTFSANDWHLSFEGDVASWIQSEIDSSLAPQEDTATRLFGHLRKLSKPTTPLQTVMRQVYLVEFHHLRRIFNTHFTSCTREPLATYISKRLDLQTTEVRSVCKYLAQAGERLNDIAGELDGFGALLLPHDIARTRLEKRAQKGPELDGVIRSLKHQGLARREGTESFYNLANEFISRRCDEGARLVESIYRKQSGSRRKPGTRIKIESLGIEPTTTSTEGGRPSLSSDLRLERAGVSTVLSYIQESDQNHGAFHAHETTSQDHDVPMEEFHGSMFTEVIRFNNVLEGPSFGVPGGLGF
ncbi:hypothetical protein FJTKL_11670 [Diaporthe vaccinii]|uniref:Uncharacterized protein n=1 Tax=Diaporthe vaccinii TaxID=105482 RepID=A0ABR4EFJ6_9PEZI